jgi:glycosyltransferase involved in cell wall biosynthesis
MASDIVVVNQCDDALSLLCLCVLFCRNLTAGLFMLNHQWILAVRNTPAHIFWFKKLMSSAKNFASLTCTAFVDVIIPVHNSSETIVETVNSAMHQTVPRHLRSSPLDIDVAVCCYNDGSDDDSWSLLCQLETTFAAERSLLAWESETKRIRTKLLISSSDDGVARGAGFARNRAASLRPAMQEKPCESYNYFLCLLDSDDTMHETRVAEQVHHMLSLPENDRHRTILGCTFDRDPHDSTWHYAQWANGLTDERLMLERYREVTVLQPTWMMTKARFQSLGGYVEAPHPNDTSNDISSLANKHFDSGDGKLRMIHDTYDTLQSLRLAEDLRLFHSHLYANGLLRLHRTKTPLVTYRHRAGMSQSSQTPRKLLLHLRVLAFEAAVLRGEWAGRFVVWGAGRDGKDFVKALSKDVHRRVACFVDVDEKKINGGYYVNKELHIRIPIVHFSWLAKDRAKVDRESFFGRVAKQRKVGSHDKNAENDAKSTLPSSKKRRLNAAMDLDLSVLPSLPVVVCVAMYRTGGALEANVASIGRTEGKNLWHFS